MCGIVGVISLEGSLDPSLADALPRMIDALRHRGPDGGAGKTLDRALLGHRRLSIIDRAGGHQPMANEDGSCWVVFNGEIYNHHSLRQRLIDRGHSFKTTCDTEVIVHAYEEFGTACAEHLEGMFAFAVYDSHNHRLFMARDRLGKKPLFYARFGECLHFASEIKALRFSPLWSGTINPGGLEGYLSLGYFLAPDTIYEDVYKLEPGHWLVVEKGQLRFGKYWDVGEFDQDRRDTSEIVQDLEGLLRTAVTERLESEVPLGAFLSSGIDSSLVVSYMAESVESELLAATVGFGQPTHNEISGASVTAKRYHVRHQTEVIEPNLNDILEPLVRAFDEPFADDSAIPTYYVSQMARQHVTVALTGDGGDESFGGYDFRYVPHAWECRARSWLPPRAGSPILAFLGRHWPRRANLPRALRWGTIFENLGRSAEEAYFSDLCFVKPAEARALLGMSPDADPRRSPVYEAVTRHYRQCPSESPLQKAQYSDLKVYLPNMPLVKVDRMSMAHGLEIRCPLLDRKVVEFAFRVPTETKMPGLDCKHLLKSLARQRLPEEILRLPKQGFSAPIGQWLREEHAHRFQDEVLESGSRVADYLDRKSIQRYFVEHQRGIADRSRHLWAVWMLELWHRSEESTPKSLTNAGARGLREELR